MKVFSVIGVSGSGKTTTIACVIRALTARGHRVGSVKEIHFEEFAIDTDPAGNTARHRRAGAALVTARGLHETDVLFPAMLDMRKILSFYEGFDYVVLEGVTDIPVPTIVAAHAVEDLEEKWGEFVFCVSGRLAERIAGYRGVPAISALADAEGLADLIERKVYALLPDFDPDCCTVCGSDCRAFGLRILRGEAKREDCVAGRGVELYVDGARIAMVPFVQNVLRGAALGIIRELDGYREGAEIAIQFR
ncbi:MAG: molybdopterin-guanine dinucleotide biosynthesis protein MobB [Clostridiales bacterium]|nr:molybdopterin-guanine dinucleotide biosynthesis protein MobB [Clostridiales bacterium]